MFNRAKRGLPQGFNNCNDPLCNGMLELVAMNENVGIAGFKKVDRILEETLMHSSRPLLLIYKCSCCQRIDFRANNKLSEMMNDRSVFFQSDQNAI